MRPQQRHDATVERLTADLSALFAPAAKFVVLTRARCQLLDGFPTCLTVFDVCVTRANAHWLVTPEGPVVSPDDAPIVAVNVVTADSLGGDLIRTPNTLARTAVSEYVLFDPTGEVLRPAFQTFW